MTEVKQLINLPPHHNKVYMYEGVLDQIRVLYPINPELAGKLAIAAIETVFTEHHSFEDDPMITVAMVPFMALASNNNTNYEESIEKDRDKKLNDWQLEHIANAINKGVTQTEIARDLHLSKSTVSRRVRIIRSDYPWLLDEKVAEVAENVAQKWEVAQQNENCATFQQQDEISWDFSNLRNVPQVSEISKVAQDIDIDIEMDIEKENEIDNETETFTLKDFKVKIYNNSYDEEYITTGQEILDSYNFEDDGEVREMSNEYPDAYNDLVQLGMLKKEWVF